jgi:uncharacterized membrane protein
LVLPEEASDSQAVHYIRAVQTVINVKAVTYSPQSLLIERRKKFCVPSHITGSSTTTTTTTTTTIIIIIIIIIISHQKEAVRIKKT